MSSELEELKQRIIELEAENAEIPDLRRKISEFDAERVDLRRKLSVSDAEIAELKRSNNEFLRANKEYNERRDAENAKLRAEIEELKKNNSKENAELRDRVTKVEQNQSLIDNTPIDNTHTSNNNSSNFNSGADHHEKSSQEKEMDIFLDEEDKKIVGEDIRRRNKEKKLQRESANQDSSSDTAYVSGTVNNVEKLDVPKISNCTSSELSGGGSSGTLLSHGTEAIEDNTQFQVQEGITNPIVDSKIPRDIKTVNQVNDQNKSAVDPKIVTEFVQGLLEELLSPDDQLQDMKFSPSRTLIPGSISIKKLANSFCQANVARNKSITAKRSEITLWCLFSKKFEDKVVELRSGDKKLADKTARSQIYAEMKPYLTGVSDGYLRVMTCKARKINKLFGYEYDPVTLKRIDGIAGYMVNRVTCSADRISKLTNPQIEYIIEQVKSKTASSNNKNVASAPIAPDVYFEESEEETNVVTPYPAKTNDDDVYFEESETNEVNTDDESDSDANKSDSDVYFKSDDSDSDDEYDHELHERLTREEMARKAKLEDNKPKVNDADVDFDKIIMEVLEEHETYFDDPAPQSVTVNA